jgi:hypothetical protein
MSQFNPAIAMLLQAVQAQQQTPNPMAQQAQPASYREGPEYAEAQRHPGGADILATLTNQGHAPTSSKEGRGGPLADHLKSLLPQKEDQSGTPSDTAGVTSIPIPYSNFDTRSGQGVPRISPQTSVQVPAALAGNSHFQAMLSDHVAHGGNAQDFINQYAAKLGINPQTGNSLADETNQRELNMPLKHTWQSGQTTDIIKGTGPTQTTTQYGFGNESGTQTAGGLTDLIKNSGLNPDQQKMVNTLSTTPGITSEDINRTIQNYQAQNNRVTTEADRATQEQIKGYHAAQLRQLTSAKEDLKSAIDGLGKNVADPNNVTPAEANDPIVAGYLKKVNDANGRIKELEGNVSAAEEKLGYNKMPTTAPVSPMLMNQITRPNAQPIVVNSADDLQNIPAGSVIQTPKGIMRWDGQRLYPVGQ